MKVTTSLLASLIVLGASFAGLAANSPRVSVPASQDAASALIAKEMGTRANIDLALAPIQSTSALQSYLIAHDSSSPLNALSPLKEALFVQSLQFDHRGLAAYNYGPLAGLSSDEVFEILSLFGAQSQTEQVLEKTGTHTQTENLITPNLIPLKGFRCGGAHTCLSDSTAACTGNC
ncbi:MAG TPA: hypothetical protein VL997_00095 [Dyella sp.]|nr:hypothetical protein [Dyella sp.]